MYCTQLRYPITKKLGQYDRPRVLGCEPVDGVLVILNYKVAIFI